MKKFLFVLCTTFVLFGCASESTEKQKFQKQISDRKINIVTTTGMIADGIRINFGTFEKFRETMRVRALELFGSGWLWLGVKGDSLWVFGGSNAALPYIYGISPILTIDLWEHAYYLDYEADRAKYFDSVMDNLINWDFANQNIENAVY